MKEIKLEIDGIEVSAREGQSVLNAALDAGIFIPNICSHPDLSPQGECKLCVVELRGETVLSCRTEAAEGMKVVTKSEHLAHLRNTAMELMLASHPHDCTSCRSYLNCELQSMMQYLESVHARLRSVPKKNIKWNTNNPIILREMERCIQCGRCVRACRELRDVGILEYRVLDGESYIGTAENKTLTEADCRFCGACVAVCPTGALQMDEETTYPVVPCRAACPAEVDIPRYVRLTKEGRYSEATTVIREKVPFPLALGHVCNHVCETECRRKELNEAVSIREIKLFAAQNDRAEIWKTNHKNKPATGRKVAIAGSGACGLTAAYYLSAKGHEVKVFERLPVAGGMMSTGIPEYRLPRDVVESEISALRENGVEIETSSSVESVEDLLGKPYDAVLLAVGASVGKKIPFPGADHPSVFAALDILRSVSLGETPPLGKSVTVLGGGNVAFDAARVCTRLGVEKVNLVCLEPEGAMLADDEEIQQGQEEGITIFNSKSTLSLEADGDALMGVKVIDVLEFSFGPGGKLNLTTKPGSEQIIPSDTVVFAVGQKTDLSEAMGVDLTPFGFAAVREGSCATSREGVFAAGDTVTGTRLLIEAMAAGRKAASEMDIFLGGDGNIEEILTSRDTPEGKIGINEGFAGLERNPVNFIDLDERLKGFTGIHCAYTADQAKSEAERCLQCDLRSCISKNKTWTDFIKQ